jgi:predicted phosphodiesterase
MIGIMADSHGDATAIDNAAAFLEQEGCTALYHLGDICDTNRHDTADECVARIKDHGILAVKGNNDHSLAVDARGRPDDLLDRRTLSFLEDLPLIREVAEAELVHSRPDIQQLGMSAMIGTIGRREANAYFRENPQGLLFRGHSHQPEIICGTADGVRFTALAHGQVVDLAGKRPCIVTCGALMEGWVMIWNPRTDRLTCNQGLRTPRSEAYMQVLRSDQG